MRRFVQSVLILLPMLILSQDTKTDTIGLEVEKMSYTRAPFTYNYEFNSTDVLVPYMTEFLEFVDKYDLDPSPLEHFAGIFMVTDMSPFGANDNMVGLAMAPDIEKDIKSAVFVRYDPDSTPLRTKTIVFHEMTHVMTYNKLPHCEDWVNCSSIFYAHLQGLQPRLGKFWDMEEEQLANMIRIFQKYDKQ